LPAPEPERRPERRRHEDEQNGEVRREQPRRRHPVTLVLERDGQPEAHDCSAEPEKDGGKPPAAGDEHDEHDDGRGRQQREASAPERLHHVGPEGSDHAADLELQAAAHVAFGDHGHGDRLGVVGDPRHLDREQRRTDSCRGDDVAT
jgi:hypothetical protein